jgi:hypothetical protein
VQFFLRRKNSPTQAAADRGLLRAQRLELERLEEERAELVQGQVVAGKLHLISEIYEKFLVIGNLSKKKGEMGGSGKKREKVEKHKSRFETT